MEFDTRLIHGYPVFDEHTGASSIPKYQASTFMQKDLDEVGEYRYTRFGNPTITALEKGIAAIENGGKFGFAFASGMAAISAVLLNFKAGDHLVLCENIYGGTFQLVTQVMRDFEISATFVDETDPAAWEAAIQPNTRAFYLETPSNPLLSITDIKTVAAIAKRHGLATIIDNTFMTPDLQSPLLLGADVVIHSATKFINGHSDVVAGLVITSDAAWAAKLRQKQAVLGGILGPEDAWLVMRGMKTLGLRMKKICTSAQKIAEFLQKSAEVKEVYYPGLPAHPGFAVHQKQAKSGGAVLSFRLQDGPAVKEFCRALRLPILAVSLGGVESILSFPMTMSHACVPPKDRLRQGVTEDLLRLSVGIEDADDLLSDLSQALKKIGGNNE
ncbi:MAG: PLP-dependent aspartate aminotransferase family protein [Enterococcaceae bacterium]|jgi:cystathionine beta-lyase|nr:PLP-dependent aspartate aminotransferase family protein [Enterococcaceae bacterium]MCI1919620.1 PLP-dependent aspartate aminotransferase family protein [Enterococcaceae bacterium]